MTFLILGCAWFAAVIIILAFMRACKINQGDA
jgi:hypothetical protein